MIAIKLMLMTLIDILKPISKTTGFVLFSRSKPRNSQ